PTLQAQTGRLPSGQGTDIFRRILHDSFYVTPLKVPEDLGNEPERKVLIALGDTSVLDQVPGGLLRFVQKGGAALVATDRRTDPNNANGLGPFHVWVDGRQIQSLLHPYKGLRECITIDFADDANGPVIFKPRDDLRNVVTNRPSFLHVRTPGLSI